MKTKLTSNKQVTQHPPRQPHSQPVQSQTQSFPIAWLLVLVLSPGPGGFGCTCHASHANWLRVQLVFLSFVFVGLSVSTDGWPGPSAVATVPFGWDEWDVCWFPLLDGWTYGGWDDVDGGVSCLRRAGAVPIYWI